MEFLSREIFVFLLILVISFQTSHEAPTSLKMPSMAAKAGGRFRTSETEKNIVTSVDDTRTEKPLTNVDKTTKKSNLDDYFYQYSEENDESCPNGTYWFTPAGKCIPDECEYKRDPVTGECFGGGGYYPRFGYSYSGGGGRLWRSLKNNNHGGGMRWFKG